MSRRSATGWWRRKPPAPVGIHQNAGPIFLHAANLLRHPHALPLARACWIRLRATFLRTWGEIFFFSKARFCRPRPRKAAEICGFSRATLFADLSLLSPSGGFSGPPVNDRATPLLPRLAIAIGSARVLRSSRKASR